MFLLLLLLFGTYNVPFLCMEMCQCFAAVWESECSTSVSCFHMAAFRGVLWSFLAFLKSPAGAGYLAHDCVLTYVCGACYRNIVRSYLEWRPVIRLLWTLQPLYTINGKRNWKAFKSSEVESPALQTWMTVSSSLHSGLQVEGFLECRGLMWCYSALCCDVHGTSHITFSHIHDRMNQ